MNNETTPIEEMEPKKGFKARVMGWVANLVRRIMLPGEGTDFEADGSSMRMYQRIGYVLTAVVAIMAAVAAWDVFNRGVDLGVEWNCFESSILYPLCCIAGFFAQFFSWQHTSFDTYHVWKDRNGREHREKSNDVSDVMFGNFMWPILSHLVLYPMLYGALFYYIIMVVIWLVEAILGVVLALLLLVALYPFYLLMRRFAECKHRIWLISAITVVYLLIYFGLSNLPSTVFGQLGSPAKDVTEQVAQSRFVAFVQSNANAVAVYKSPSTDSPTLQTLAPSMYIQYNAWEDDLTSEERALEPQQTFLSNGTVCAVLADEGDWYKIQIDKGNNNSDEAYVMKEHFSAFVPDNIQNFFDENARMKDYYVQLSTGKYDGMWVCCEANEMEGCTSFYLGRLVDGGLEFDFVSEIANEILPTQYDDSPYYTKHILVEDEYYVKYDWQNLPESYLDKIFQEKKPCARSVYYFKGSVDNILWF